MLVILSPAKKLDWTAQPDATTRPDFQADAVALADVAKELGTPGLKKLMHISDKLAELNLERFESFKADPEPEATRPAIHAFAGDTYTGLDAGSLDPDALNWAKGHLRILSGLYGLLRPFDAMQPYRLEMGSRLKTEKGKSLYDYWGDRISQALNAAAAEAGAKVIVNCASQEYFGAVELGALRPRVITPQFLDSKDGAEPKVISFYAKKARGAMARFVMERRLTDPAELRAFDSGGYAFDAEQSSEDRPVFIREI
ncbi:peroxide stress protein YaaA [Roseinatronobacter sp.]|uniref:peroxide stress protein YaaA n=1 Tax=Roseinatronobacter sp. TaxID=1945755 RepID=UPI0025CF3C8B|nr:peroxide stress protein YaaA [Roseibaca sp.]